MWEWFDKFGIDRRFALVILLLGVGLVLILIGWAGVSIRDALKGDDPIVEITSNIRGRTEYEITIRSTEWKDTKIFIKAGQFVYFPHATGRARFRVNNEIEDVVTFTPESSGNLFVKGIRDGEFKVEVTVGDSMYPK